MTIRDDALVELIGINARIAALAETFQGEINDITQGLETLHNQVSEIPVLPVPPPAVRRRFLGGNYIKPGKGYAKLAGGLKTFVKYKPLFAGVMMEITWAAWEPVLGRRDLTVIEEALEDCEEVGAKLSILFQTQEYSGSKVGLCPTGKLADGSDLTPCIRSSTTFGTPLYLPEVGDAYADGIREIATRFDSDPTLEFVFTSESASGNRIDSNPGYSTSAMLENGFRKQYEAFGSFIRTTPLGSLNGFAGKDKALVGWLKQYGLGIHRTDAFFITDKSGNKTAIDAIPLTDIPTPRVVECSLGAVTDRKMGVAGAYQWGVDYGCNGFIWPSFNEFPAAVALLKSLIPA